MVEFNIGDKVKVKNNLIVGNTYGHDGLCYFAEDMEKYKGKVYTIQNIDRKDRYTLNLEDDFYWEFTHDMLDLVELDSEYLLKTALKLLDMEESELIIISDKLKKREKELDNLKHDIHLTFVKKDCSHECQLCEYSDYAHCEIPFTIDELAKKDLLNLD